jgi:hypothetical protein
MTETEARERILRFSSEKLGKLGERIWASVITASGLRYIPLSEIESGGAPMLEGAGKTILPDFDVYGMRKAVFVEAKAKTQSVLYENAWELRHGINERNYRDYMRIRWEARKRCGLAVLELLDGETGKWSGSLLVESLQQLGEPFAGFSTDKHKVFWPRKRFRDLDSWTAMEILARANGEPSPSYRVELTDIFAVKEEEFQGSLF